LWPASAFWAIPSPISERKGTDVIRIFLHMLGSLGVKLAILIVGSHLLFRLDYPYRDFVCQRGTRHGVGEVLMRAVINAESDLSQYIASLHGALGLGQWMDGAGVLAILFGVYALMGWSHLALLEGWFGKHGENY